LTSLDGKKVCICRRDGVLHEAELRLISRTRTWWSTLHTHREKECWNSRRTYKYEPHQSSSYQDRASTCSEIARWRPEKVHWVNAQREHERRLQKECTESEGAQGEGGDVIADGERSSRVLCNASPSTEAVPGLYLRDSSSLHIRTAAPDPLNTHPQTAQNESNFSYQEPVLPSRLVLRRTLSHSLNVIGKFLCLQYGG
jgi:hypothetical protein